MSLHSSECRFIFLLRPNHLCTFGNLCGFFVRAGLQSKTGLLKTSFQSSKKVNKVNSGGTQHLPNKTRALHSAWKTHYQVKELIQYLQMWMKSWGAVNKTAPKADARFLWMGLPSQERQSKLIRDERRADKLFFCRKAITARDQFSMSAPHVM